MIYLDNNATTLLEPRVLEEMIPLLSGPPVNASSIHRFGQRAKGYLTQALKDCGECLGVASYEIVFTSGGTEAINMTIQGILAKNKKGHVISSNLEHSAVLHTLQLIEKKGFEVSYLNPEEGKGTILPYQVQASIRADTCLIVLIGANNETGAITDLEAIASIAEEHKIPLVVDGVAWLGKASLHIPQGISACCFSSHKIHGPTGIGMAFIRKKLKWEPLILGGNQQGGRRGGTEHLPGIVGFSKALKIMTSELASSLPHMKKLRDQFEELIVSKVPNVLIHCKNENRLCNTSNIAFLGVDGETLLMRLDLAGVAASHGAACSSGTLEPSRILLMMGVSQKIARSSLRFSLSKFTTENEIQNAVEIIANEVEIIRK